ncbi:hypothetical protein PTKIN_Ptkin14bG0030300 [Pterospermum kingtungense]
MSAAYPSGWSELPKELLCRIAKRLDTRLDVLRYRAVCSSWRASVPVPPKCPALPVEVHFLVNHPTRPLASFLLSQTTVYRVEPGFETHSRNKTWLIKVEETKKDNNFRVLNPFSQHPIKNLPASFPKELNNLNFRVVETARVFSMQQMRDDGDDCFIEDNSSLIRKIKLASNFDSSSVIVAIKRGDLCQMRVNNDIQWHLFDSDVHYRDITNFNGKFFTVDLYGVILGFNENSFSLEEVHSPLEQMVWEGERYFLESCGHLYIVVRDFYCCAGQVYYDKRIDGFVKETRPGDYVPVQFRVYKRIPSDHLQNRYDWVEVNDLGDRVFFVSTNCSFSFSIRDCDGCHGNCIIYVDEVDKIQRLDGEEIDADDNDNDGLRQLRYAKVGLFNLANGSSAPIAFFPRHLAMFWPPPTWLMWNQCSSSS